MNRTDLKAELDRLEIPDRCYSIVGVSRGRIPPVDGGVHLDGGPGAWRVYGWERGEDFNVDVYEDEADACADMLSRMSGPGWATVRDRPPEGYPRKPTPLSRLSAWLRGES